MFTIELISKNIGYNIGRFVAASAFVKSLLGMKYIPFLRVSEVDRYSKESAILKIPELNLKK